jgi:hypothetical protein
LLRSVSDRAKHDAVKREKLEIEKLRELIIPKMLI